MPPPKSQQINRLFARPVIPVVGALPPDLEVLASASSVIVQGASLTELPQLIETLTQPPRDHLGVLVHIDLVAGLENNDAGLEYLARLDSLDGIVTVHHQLTQAARRLGLLSIVRVFVSDSRALERGLKVVAKSRPDAFEILPAAAAVKVAEELRRCAIPHIAGGLCRTEEDVREALSSGSRAVTSTRHALWQLNASTAQK
jgi:glycerol uptake operon antiterminator